MHAPCVVHGLLFICAVVKVTNVHFDAQDDMAHVYKVALHAFGWLVLRCVGSSVYGWCMFFNRAVSMWTAA